jgi:hypothetical protein
VLPSEADLISLNEEELDAAGPGELARILASLGLEVGDELDVDNLRHRIQRSMWKG